MFGMRPPRQMSDQDSSSSASHTEEEEEEEEEKDMKGPPPSMSNLSTTLSTVIRIKQKYQALKKRRQEMALVMGGLTGAPARASPKIFTFDITTSSLAMSSAPCQRKKKKRKRRVLFPDRKSRSRVPTREHSPAEYCLCLLSVIVFFQVYNAIENLDDHVLRYDLEGLEKTLRREVFGQQGAVEDLLSQLKDYLSTYVHNKPLVLSLHGPSGVGKSHLGRLLAGHFRSVVGEPLVLQYYVLHHCPQEADALQCAQDLHALISALVERAEEEEKIPLLVFDEVEHMQGDLLDVLHGLVASKQSNQFLNAVYVFLSNLGHQHVTKHVLHNVSTATATSCCNENPLRDLTPILRKSLEELHALWTQADILPLGLLEKSHVMKCFLDEMTQEGFYPDRTHVERLASEVEYYPTAGGREYSVTGCKQVVAKVNLL
ncbi:torsin-4A isoform X2 [Dunckerocampus dactyliophorus]|uniref:torsin-4A isoform X2 n=1 Tax=Dunckerocampus dactyliophorus TaxID=161453 RepID=UPI002405C502|nr:torsin-4A isoform X2 [Dunckerocampus dactyliophorus]